MCGMSSDDSRLQPHFNFLKIFVIFIVQTETCAYLWEIVELFIRAEA